MSEKILSSLAIAEGLASIFLVGLAVTFILLAIYGGVYFYFSRKKASLEKERREEQEEYYKERSKICDPLFSTESEIMAAELKELDETHENEEDRLNGKITAINHIRDRINDHTLNIKIIATIVLVIVFTFMCMASVTTGGNVGTIRAIEGEKTDIQATAYMITNYDYTEQDTLTVYIKNNSQKTLNDATIEETHTGETATVECLAPGQEKIVTMAIYPIEDEDYNFEFKSVNFK